MNSDLSEEAKIMIKTVSHDKRKEIKCYHVSLAKEKQLKQVAESTTTLTQPFISKSSWFKHCSLVKSEFGKSLATLNVNHNIRLWITLEFMPHFVKSFLWWCSNLPPVISRLGKSLTILKIAYCWNMGRPWWADTYPTQIIWILVIYFVLVTT